MRNGNEKEPNQEFLPVLLASDINVYSMARAFHEAYGVKSLFIARELSTAVRHSRILEYIEEPELDSAPVFLATMDRVYRQYGSGRRLLLIGCADHYVRLIVENKALLQDRFILPYADLEVLNNIILKETFYNLCDEYDLDHAATFVHTPQTGSDFELPFDFPVVVKASDSVKYHRHRFDGFHKVFFVHKRAELDLILKKIYAAGYDDNLIIQSLIPGSDDCLYDLHVYAGRDRKVKLMSFGNVVLEEHTPTAIGSNAATLVDHDPVIMDKVKNFLEGIGFQGLCDCDLKYDRRDDVLKILEINIRQGRSHYRVTGAGDNLARYLVEDYIYGKTTDEVKYATDPFFWHVVPLGIVYRYVADREKRRRIRELVRTGRSANSLYYKRDLSLKRRFVLHLHDLNMYRKYRRYYNPK